MFRKREGQFKTLETGEPLWQTDIEGIQSFGH